MILDMQERLQIPLKPTSLSIERETRSGFWEVAVDDNVFSSSMTPFKASDSILEGFACQVCGIQGCGHTNVLVRRCGEFLLWIYAQVLEPDFEREFSNLPEIYAFDAEAYEATVSKGDVADLKELSACEVSTILKLYLPDPTLALYFEPVACQDPRGKSILRSLREAICTEADANSDAVRLSSEWPQSLVEYRVGLDLPGVPECRFILGQSSEGTVVSFLSYPKLPLWIVLPPSFSI